MESELSMSLPPQFNCTVAVIGLGYVGLPLAVAFANPKECLRTGEPMQRRVIGFDINLQRLSELRQGIDRTHETSLEELQAATLLELSSDEDLLAAADVFLVTVPTPIDSTKRPDLNPLKRASTTVSKALKARAAAGTRSMPIVIYESTVYPGATEEICVPILEQWSGLHFNIDFACGYSPERINPGDINNKLTTIIKVTSGSTTEVARWVDDFYGSIIKAGTHRVATLKVAEAAKVIENTQRDLNIALVNELAMIFARLGIDTLDVLEAAGTKWNFLPFRPGLVGGHCIGVDPYYLTYKAEEVGYHPQVVLAGRRINDGMAEWVVHKLVMEMARRGLAIGGAQVLVLGLAFKENCPDMRNSKVIDMINALLNYNIKPLVVDPWVDPQEALHEHGLSVFPEIPSKNRYTAVMLAVAHNQFAALEPAQWQQLLAPKGVLVDIKGIAPRHLMPLRI